MVGFSSRGSINKPTATTGCLAFKIFLIVTLTPFQQHYLCSYTSGALMGINSLSQMAEKMAPPCMARQDLVNCIRFRKMRAGIFKNLNNKWLTPPCFEESCLEYLSVCVQFLHGWVIVQYGPTSSGRKFGEMGAKAAPLVKEFQMFQLVERSKSFCPNIQLVRMVVDLILKHNS